MGRPGNVHDRLRRQMVLVYKATLALQACSPFWSSAIYMLRNFKKMFMDVFCVERASLVCYSDFWHEGLLIEFACRINWPRRIQGSVPTCLHREHIRITD